MNSLLHWVDSGFSIGPEMVTISKCQMVLVLPRNRSVYMWAVSDRYDISPHKD
ncbi:hypothetical protein IMCC3135_01285 [Granulosicoccus antarcticus IMCC3135]|uniref:Uncharacterized protein n=1 Tax=Granulosicoccus antarcticus IMCC3135 TaxID=1192854 RepID=A0A2Z2NGG2_9GAMM|nr:hypothetical protein IMCC3135_01285 [Granulosicoccus antarcticus IMCC3135]